MLVLSRKKGEQIRIGEKIVITVQRMSGNRVSIGIEAPPECRIVRGELQVGDLHTGELRGDEQSKPATNVNTPESQSPVQVSLQRIPRSELGKPLGGNRIAEHLKRTLGAK